MAGKPDAIIYTIGVFNENDGDQNPGVLRRLAKDTGGEAFLPQSLEEVLPICERIAHDIRNQYTIGYKPTTPMSRGGYRAVKVDARSRNGKLVVRTKSGYYAGNQSAAVTK